MPSFSYDRLQIYLATIGGSCYPIIIGIVDFGFHCLGSIRQSHLVHSIGTIGDRSRGPQATLFNSQTFAQVVTLFDSNL